MIVLDTNVVSELMRAEPEPRVIAWVDDLDASETCITTITAAELLHGVALLPIGRRRTRLAETVQTVLDDDFGERVLSFDLVAAAHYADIAAHRSHLGRPISHADAQIAAVCRSHAATLATRNVADFDETGLTIVDPWAPPT
ncbi:MAG: type II toxin-antitoxin system VapC family toxin [Acidimicrobiales bacterium]|nr:type II toxin-antitoxin system VapC family toxin [Acidimicrobiales bacterium]